MNKDELEKQLALNGWEITKEIEEEKGIIVYFLSIASKNTCINFECRMYSYAYIYEIFGKGRKKINKEDFFFIIEYLKEKKVDKPVVFEIEGTKMTNAWANVFENFFETKTYQKLNHAENQFMRTIYLGINCLQYTTQRDLERLEHFASYLPEIEKIAKEHEKKAFFFVEKDSVLSDFLNDFFFSINDYQCVIGLENKDKILKLCVIKEDPESIDRKVVKEWDIYKKDEIRKYLQEFIEKTEENQRIRNMYGISLFFFKQYCKFNHISPYKKAQEALLPYYSEKEIELIAIKVWKYKEDEKFVNHTSHLTLFGNKAIYLNDKTDELKILTNEQEISEYIEKIKKNIS